MVFVSNFPFIIVKIYIKDLNKICLNNLYELSMPCYQIQCTIEIKNIDVLQVCDSCTYIYILTGFLHFAVASSRL